jgi:hypothetical protein
MRGSGTAKTGVAKDARRFADRLGVRVERQRPVAPRVMDSNAPGYRAAGHAGPVVRVPARNGYCTVLPSVHGLSVDCGSGAPG